MRRVRLRVIFALASLLPLAAAAATPAPDLRVDGTAFTLRASDGRILRGAELIGAELDLGDGSSLRIEGVRPDPEDASGEVLLHRLSVRTGDDTWENPCEAAPDGTREAFPLAGNWNSEGRFVQDPRHFSISCTSGAQAKCVRFGYKPWKSAADGTALAPLYEACVHMVRADYCGDGLPSTRDGTLIDIYDRHGIQSSGGGADLRFEAGWSATGAVCVARTRIPENLDLAALARRCPQLRAMLGASCTEDRAQSLGALLFNRSR